MRVQLMRFIGIIVVALVLIGLISLVLLNPLFPDPSTACSKVPPPLTTANNNHSAIQFFHPEMVVMWLLFINCPFSSKYKTLISSKMAIRWLCGSMASQLKPMRRKIVFSSMAGL